MSIPDQISEQTADTRSSDSRVPNNRRSQAKEVAQADRSDWLSIAAAAARYNQRKAQVSGWVFSGHVETCKINGFRYVSQASVEAHIARAPNHRHANRATEADLADAKVATGPELSSDAWVGWAKLIQQNLPSEVLDVIITREGISVTQRQWTTVTKTL